MFYLLLCCTACRILIPKLGVESVPHAVELQSLNHGTTRKFLYLILNLLVLGLGHLVAQMVMCLSINVGDLGWRPGLDPWVGKIPWRRKWQPTPVLLPRKSHGRRSLVQATVHGVTKSRARLSDFTFTIKFCSFSSPSVLLAI